MKAEFQEAFGHWFARFSVVLAPLTLSEQQDEVGCCRTLLRQVSHDVAQNLIQAIVTHEVEGKEMSLEEMVTHVPQVERMSSSMDTSRGKPSKSSNEYFARYEPLSELTLASGQLIKKPRRKKAPLELPRRKPEVVQQLKNQGRHLRRSIRQYSAIDEAA